MTEIFGRGQSGQLPSRQPLFKFADYRTLAWLSLATAPVFWFLGMFAGHIPYLFWPQYVEGEGLEPWWFSMIATLCFMCPVVLPTVGAIHFARKARTAGLEGAQPAIFFGWLWLAVNVLVLGIGLFASLLNG